MKLINGNKAQVCRACLNVKPVNQFYKNYLSETGYCKFCKDCGHPATVAHYRRHNQQNND